MRIIPVSQSLLSIHNAAAPSLAVSQVTALTVMAIGAVLIIVGNIAGGTPKAVIKPTGIAILLFGVFLGASPALD